MVFGAIAFSATAAQAEVGAQWLLAEKAPGTNLVKFLEASVGLEAETTLVLHTKIAGTAVLFLCTQAEAVNVVLKANGSIGEGAKIRFSSCTTNLNGVTSKPCEPNNGGTEPGVIMTSAGHGLLILHKLANGAVDDLIKITPDAGTTYFAFQMGEECAIGEKVPVIGSVTLRDCENLSLTHLVKHLVEFSSTTALTELWVVSKTAEHVSTILGSAWAFLAGAHEGLKFSGDPA
jgi:hypothetical protein